MPGKLFLLPNLLGEEAVLEDWLPSSVARAISGLDGLIAESEKGGRHYLRRFAFPAPKTFRDIPIVLLNEHTKEIKELLAPMLQGQTWGIVSDCGLPCLADPGAALVFHAREAHVAIEAFVGPSSLILGLMLSGFPAQRFAFHGYLDRELKQVAIIEKRSREDKSTQLFIETPYRTQKLLTQLLEKLHPKTQLCIAWDLTLPTQGVITQKVAEWKQKPLPALDKKAALFLICAYDHQVL